MNYRALKKRMSRINTTKNANNPRRPGQARHSNEMEERIQASIRRKIAELKYKTRKIERRRKK